MGRPEPDDSESSDSDESDETDRIVASPSPAATPGALPPSFLRDLLYDMLKTDWLTSFGGSYWNWSRTLEPGNWVDDWARCAGVLQAGWPCKMRQDFASKAPTCWSGKPTNTTPPMNGAAGAKNQRTSQRLEGQPSMPDPPPITGRPRSLRAARFQRPGHLHPLDHLP